MAGKKGRSGRKSRYTEVQEGRLGSVCANWLTENFDKFDEKTKLRIALTIAPKTITEKKDIKTDQTVHTHQLERERQLINDVVKEAERCLNG